MFCGSCQEERLGLRARYCVVCGTRLGERSTPEVATELTHVRYVLREIPRWQVQASVKEYLTDRYSAKERVLTGVLREEKSLSPEAVAALAPVAPPPAPGAAPPPAPGAAPPPAPGAAPVPATAPEARTEAPAVQAAVEPARVEAQGEAPAAPAEATPAPDVRAEPSAPAEGAKPDPDESPRPEVRDEETGARADEALPPLPEIPGGPLFDVPPARGPAEQVIEEASNWSRVWKPFLYESVGWFIGGFLILAGTFYFVAESWAGMTSLSRSLLVFALTGGYAAGFRLWGGFFSRKETLAGAGRILELIGAAVAPLTAIALQPLAGEHPLMLWALAPLAGVGAALLARGPAEKFGALSTRALLGLAFLATVMLGLAPLLARGGAGMVWLNAVPVVLLWPALQLRGGDGAERRASAFAYLAPAYLLALFALALHLALAQAGVAPSIGTYAPLLAAVAGLSLRMRTLEGKRAADALSVGVMAAQLAFVVLSASGQPPAFFFTSVIATFSAWTLSRGSVPRARWLHGAYVAGYLAYQSAGQLVPGPLMELLAKVRAALGYGEEQKLPFSFAAVYAMPYVLGLAAWAVRQLRGAKRAADPERQEAVAEVLLRSTSGASAFFILLAVTGGDARPSLWTVPVLGAVCAGLGLWLDRRYLTWTGVAGALLVPFILSEPFGRPAATAVSGVVCLGFAVLSAVLPERENHGRSIAVNGLAAIIAVMAWWPPFHLAGAAGLLLAAAGVGVMAWDRVDATLRLFSAALAASAVPLAFLVVAPAYAPLALAVAALALAVLSDRGGALLDLRGVGLVANVVAAVWQVGVQVQAEQFGRQVPMLLGVVLLLGVAACTVCARKDARLGMLGALFLGPALLPELGPFTPWPGLTPLYSLLLYVALAVGASTWTAVRGRSLAAAWYAAVGIVCTAVVLGAAVAPMHDVPWFLFGLGAFAALASSRALSPAFCVPWAAMLALGAFIPEGHLLVLVLLLTGLALLDEVPKVRELLLGERRIGLITAVCAGLVALLSASARNSLGGPYVTLGLYVVLPLLWVRASRRPFFIAALPLLPLLFVQGPNRTYEEALWALPVLAGVLTRLTWHLPRARTLLLAEGETGAAWLPRFLFLSLGTCGLALFSLHNGREGGFLAAIAASMVLGAGGPLPLRLVGAAVMVLLVPEAWPPSVGVALAVAIAVHRAPQLAAKALGAEEDRFTRPVAAYLALGLAFLPWLTLRPTPGHVLLQAATVLLCASILSWRWMMAAVPLLVAVALGRKPWALEPALPFSAVTLGAAVFAAVALRESVARRLTAFSRWVGPGFEKDWSEPWWIGATLPFTVALGMSVAGELQPTPFTSALLVAAALTMMVARQPWQAATASALLAGALWTALPAPWAPVAVAAGGALLCLVGHLLHDRVAIGPALHHAGWVMALLALLGLRSLHDVATPLTAAFATSCAWIVSRRRSALEAGAWAATLAFLHLLVFHLGVVFSTGKPPGYVFPYLAFISAGSAAVVLLLPHRSDRRTVGLVFTVVAMLETIGGLSTIGQQAPREAWIGVVSMVGLFGVLVRTALVRKDEWPAHLAQGTLALAYLVVRLHGMGASSLGGGDSLAALVAGAVFSGLYVWTRRQGESLRIFVRPALTGAFLIPLVGLFAAPWHDPMVTAALLVGFSAHFAALATQEDTRRAASVLATVAFNGALVMAWLGTGAGEPQYYVIPAGLSLLALIRLFREDLSPLWEARLRAIAITGIYAATAWRPLMFEAGWAMVICVFVCVVGVAVGVGMRIRSYVYLGTAFLVTTVIANMVRYGARDHRLGALFLSGLGLLVVGFMAVVTSKRAELMKRYERVKEMLEDWQG